MSEGENVGTRDTTLTVLAVDSEYVLMFASERCLSTCQITSKVGIMLYPRSGLVDLPFYDLCLLRPREGPRPYPSGRTQRLYLAGSALRCPLY